MFSKFLSPNRISGEDGAPKDCLACRLVTGGGLLGMGAYILAYSNRKRQIESFTLKGLALVAAGLGIARLANAEFLKAQKTE